MASKSDKIDALIAELNSIPDDKYTPRKDQIRILKLRTEIDKLIGGKKRPEGMKDGGMNNVPSKYKGFSKLPEGVQEKISPSLAKKYKTGGMSKAVMKARGGTFKGTFQYGITSTDGCTCNGPRRTGDERRRTDD